MKDTGRRILFMRHGDTGLTGRWVGSSDVALSAEGAAQIASLAGRVDVAENLPLRAAVKITRPDMKDQRTHLLDIDALTARCQLFSNRWARACH